MGKLTKNQRLNPKLNEEELYLKALQEEVEAQVELELKKQYAEKVHTLKPISAAVRFGIKNPEWQPGLRGNL